MAHLSLATTRHLQIGVAAVPLSKTETYYCLFTFNGKKSREYKVRTLCSMSVPLKK